MYILRDPETAQRCRLATLRKGVDQSKPSRASALTGQRCAGVVDPQVPHHVSTQSAYFRVLDHSEVKHTPHDWLWSRERLHLGGSLQPQVREHGPSCQGEGRNGMVEPFPVDARIVAILSEKYTSRCLVRWILVQTVEGS